MKSEKEIIELLNGILEEKLVLTDIEDRYVYSHEKIFLEQSNQMVIKETFLFSIQTCWFFRPSSLCYENITGMK